MIPTIEQKDREERLALALERIRVWSGAYPPDVFPEPDLKKARLLLEQGGMTLDDVSACAMRHALAGVGRIAAEALQASDSSHAEHTADG